MKTFLQNGAALPTAAILTMLIFAVGVVYAVISSIRTGESSRHRVTPPIFGKAVVVCASLGGLQYFNTLRVNAEKAYVTAVCNTGVEARFQIRYDGKPEGETK